MSFFQSISFLQKSGNLTQAQAARLQRIIQQAVSAVKMRAVGVSHESSLFKKAVGLRKEFAIPPFFIYTFVEELSDLNYEYGERVVANYV